MEFSVFNRGKVHFPHIFTNTYVKVQYLSCVCIPLSRSLFHDSKSGDHSTLVMVTIISLFQLRWYSTDISSSLCSSSDPSLSDAFLLWEELVFFLDLGTGGVEEGSAPPFGGFWKSRAGWLSCSSGLRSSDDRIFTWWVQAFSSSSCS